ncbi:MAG: hypothetical protein ACKVU2_05805 [Saprospiraceae bacterium]
MTAAHPFNDLINFLAVMAPEQVLAFKPSEATIKRVRWLLEREQTGLASREEHKELDRYMLQEDLMVIAKARARLRLSRV